MPRGARLQRLEGRTMGTSWQVLVAAVEPLDALADALQAELDLVVAQMSGWEPDSALCRYNRAPAGSRVVLPPEFFDVLRASCELAAQTQGAYDPSAGALVDCWGFGPAPRRREAPPDADVREALTRVGWRRLLLDAADRSLLQPGGLQLDLSSIAKGYGVDRLALALIAHGVGHFLCEIGGELRGQGCKPDGQPWWVAPEGVPDANLAHDGGGWRIALDGLSIATSGDYRRYFDSIDEVEPAQRYAHTIDPRSGRPVRSAPAAVTVLHPDCHRADALATALTVMGLQDGMAFAERHGIAALIVQRRAAAPAIVDEFASSAWLGLAA